MTNTAVPLSIQELYTKVSQLLSNNLSLFRGLTISGVSIDIKLAENPTYPNVYCKGTSEQLKGNKKAKNSINLKIPNSTITVLKKENPLISASGTKYDIIIDNIDVSPSGQITATAMSIKETGLSDRELLNRRLTAYCEKKGYFGLQKRPLPYFVRSVVAITSDNSTISDDILSNLKLPLNKIIIYKCKTSGEIAKAIASNTNLDITVLFRGGREDEHMAIFSSEDIIDAIRHSKVPVCIALGHEIDRPFVYAIGDHDYPTPSAFAKAIAELNQNAKKDQLQLFNSIKDKLINITHTAFNQVTLKQERVENLCKQIVIAKIKGIEIIEKKIDTCIDATKTNAIFAIDLRNKQIEFFVNNIIHHKISSIERSLYTIERLANEAKARQETKKIQSKATKYQRSLIAVLGIIVIAFITYLLFKQ